MKISVIFGAGFSKWSCDLPLVTELFDFAIRPYNSTEERRVVRLKKTYEVWRGLHPRDHTEAFIRFAQGPTSRFNLVNWYITRRLTEPFVVRASRRYTWYINSYYPRSHDGVQKARRIIDLLREAASIGGMGIVTTNYDLVVEYALGSRSFNYGIVGEQIGFIPYPYPQPVHVIGNVPIAKLHGSISWSETAKFPDSRCGLTGKCLIVPPITEKRAPPLLKQQWELAKSTLSKCDKLVVFGFSFNEFDIAVRKFVAKNIPSTAEIILIDVVDHRKRLSSLFVGHNMTYIDCSITGFSERVKAKLMPP
jgi:hypothetical protein